MTARHALHFIPPSHRPGRVEINQRILNQPGAWIYGEGEHQHSRRTAFAALKEAHRDFHRNAGAVADAINAGQSGQAKQMLAENSEFAHATEHTVAAIQALRREIS